MQVNVHIDSFESGSTPLEIWFVHDDSLDDGYPIYTIDDELWTNYQNALTAAKAAQDAIFLQLQAQGCPDLDDYGWGPPTVLVR